MYIYIYIYIYIYKRTNPCDNTHSNAGAKVLGGGPFGVRHLTSTKRINTASPPGLGNNWTK